MATLAQQKESLRRRRARLIAEGSIRPAEYNKTKKIVTYVGKPCPYGHSGERYAGGHCIECHRARIAENSARYRKSPEYAARQRIHQRNSYLRRKQRGGG